MAAGGNWGSVRYEPALAAAVSLAHSELSLALNGRNGCDGERRQRKIQVAQLWRRSRHFRRARLQSFLCVNQLLKLTRVPVVELEKNISDPVEIIANEELIAQGKVVITSGDKIGGTLTELVKSIYNQSD
jgi:Type III flagellar switch regulator (C-ring) FliN C-term